MIDAFELVPQITKRIVLKLVDELTGSAVDAHGFVDVTRSTHRRRS